MSDKSWEADAVIDLEDILERLGIVATESEMENLKYRGERRFQKIIWQLLDIHHEEIEELAKEVYEEVKEDSDSEEEDEDEEEDSDNED